MAIFSNDPNIGIRQMGMEAFIPTPVSSITYKSRAGVDARRRKNYQNAPLKSKPGPAHEVITLPDGNKVSVLMKDKKKGKSPSLMFPHASVPKPGQFGYAPPASPVPNIRIPSAAQIADGIIKLEDQMKKDRANRWPWEKDPMENAGRTDLPSTMFRGGAMFA